MTVKNILILSMSILPNKLSQNYYQYEEDYTFRGISQLEAGTKFFLKKLQTDGEDSNKIYKICILESLKANRDQRSVENYLDTDNLHFVEQDAEGSVLTNAVGFYKERIRQYLLGKECSHADQEKAVPGLEQKANETMELGGLLEELYTEADMENLFEVFQVEDEGEQGLYQCIRRLCDGIRSEKSKENEVRLFLDMQGARRHETFIVNSAVKMLEMSGIKVEGSVAIDFGPANLRSGKPNAIVDTTINNRIYDMVAGMNEFLQTGRGDTLYNFLDSDKMKGMEAEKGVIEVIKEISNAIMICDMDQFGRSLNKLSERLAEYEERTDKNPLFAAFVQDLRADYDVNDLLTRKDSSRPLMLDQVGWCVRKQLYQQALTLIEARTPDVAVDNRILYYKDDAEMEELLHRMLEQKNAYGKRLWDPPSYLLDEKKPGVKPKNVKYVWFKSALRNPNSKKPLAIKHSKLVCDLRPGVVKPEDEQAVKELWEKYRDLSEMRNKINHASDDEEGKKFWEKHSDRDLSETQNKKDHASDDEEGKKLAILKGLIKEFDDYFMKLINDGVRVDLSLKYPLKEQGQNTKEGK